MIDKFSFYPKVWGERSEPQINLLGECSALWGEREGVYGALVFRSTTFFQLQAPHILTTVSLPALPTFNICLWNWRQEVSGKRLGY